MLKIGCRAYATEVPGLLDMRDTRLLPFPFPFPLLEPRWVEASIQIIRLVFVTSSLRYHEDEHA